MTSVWHASPAGSDLCVRLPRLRATRRRLSNQGLHTLRFSLPHIQRLNPVSVTPANSEAVGVIIVDHGSKKAESNEMLNQFVTLYRDNTGHKIVEAAHMEIARPSILDAVSNCVKQGATKLIVAPYFLSRGRHIQQDIPALVAEAQEAYPQVECTVADPIGIDPLMVTLISQRVEAALQEATKHEQAA